MQFFRTLQDESNKTSLAQFREESSEILFVEVSEKSKVRTFKLKHDLLHA